MRRWRDLFKFTAQQSKAVPRAVSSPCSNDSATRVQLLQQVAFIMSAVSAPHALTHLYHEFYFQTLALCQDGIYWHIQGP